MLVHPRRAAGRARRLGARGGRSPRSRRCRRGSRSGRWPWRWRWAAGAGIVFGVYPGVPRRAARSDHRPPRRIASRALRIGSGTSARGWRSPSTRCAPTSSAPGSPSSGVVIGVTTVMAIASMVQGIRAQIFNAIEIAGPTAFYVVRFFSQTPVNPDRPALRGADPADRAPRRDAEAMARLPRDRVRGHVGAAVPADRVPGRRARRRSPSSAPTTTTWTSRAARCSGAGSSPGRS